MSDDQLQILTDIEKINAALDQDRLDVVKKLVADIQDDDVKKGILVILREAEQIKQNVRILENALIVHKEQVDEDVKELSKKVDSQCLEFKIKMADIIASAALQSQEIHGQLTQMDAVQCSMKETTENWNDLLKQLLRIAVVGAIGVIIAAVCYLFLTMFVGKGMVLDVTNALTTHITPPK